MLTRAAWGWMARAGPISMRRSRAMSSPLGRSLQGPPPMPDSTYPRGSGGTGFWTKLILFSMLVLVASISVVSWATV